jgi:hypothetical protein
MCLRTAPFDKLFLEDVFLGHNQISGLKPCTAMVLM